MLTTVYFLDKDAAMTQFEDAITKVTLYMSLITEG
jgi:hypothetical protein